MRTSSIRIRAALLRCALLTLLAVAAVHAQPGTDDCTQGYRYPPDVDPRYYWAHCFPEVGTMSGDGVGCRYGSEDFGRAIASVRDVNDDGLMDWVVSHARCDTIFPPYVPTELLLYKGVKGRLPDAPSGERIGPSEIGSTTEFLASGDWDGDGYRDIATRVWIIGDTSGGNHTGYEVASLVIFWGNSAGTYSVADTSRLSCEAEMWLGIYQAVGVDLDKDGVDDLLVLSGTKGLSQGQRVQIAQYHLYRGSRHGRWGQVNRSSRADWLWWGGPPTNAIGALDQNGDGTKDIALFDNEDAGTGHVSVLYGNVGGGLPDTTDVDTVNLYLANGHYALFSDITGDGIPELLLSCGNEQQVKIFIGLKGQRLLRQYGSGNDPAHPGSPEWWGRPWANVWLPNRLQSDWTRANHELFDAGDGNLDGLRDIWAVSDPFALCYSSGEWLDSLADGLVYEPYAETVSDIVNLGDIDGSGIATIAVAPAVGSHSGRIIYIKPDTTIPRYGEVYRDTVPGTGPGTAGVPDTEQRPLPSMNLSEREARPTVRGEKQ